MSETTAVKTTPVKGFHDILPPHGGRREGLVRRVCGILDCYGYERIDVPLLERGDLFVRSVGASTDIVEKEMYAFEDKDREHTLLALRPEGTASVVRAFLDSGGPRHRPQARFYYSGPMFRRERPQKGRLRQFHQVGAECLGREDPACDAEVLCLVDDLCRGVGLQAARIRVNSLGDARCRPAYREALARWAQSHARELCEDCRARLGRSPLRILDCKKQGCLAATSTAPMMVDHLCEPCREHYQRVVSLATSLGLSLDQEPRMVRGLDYYCRTAFEIAVEQPSLGAQNAIGGGGRYDGLVSALGGPDTPGIGFALGIERMELAGARGEEQPAVEVFIAPLSPPAEAPALDLARRLRAHGASVLVDSGERRLKTQMKRADRAGARYVVILGPEELATGRPAVRDMIEKVDQPGCFELHADAAEILARIRGEATT